MNPSDVPRIKELMRGKPALWREWSDKQLCDLADHAIQLERELNAQIKANKSLKVKLCGMKIGT